MNVFSSIPLAQTITQLCLDKDIKHIVICPGSRNAPLTIGFTENKDFTCYSIVDERCAAFFAMGLAQQLQHPVAVVCTSGSALLNFYPAVAEAFYSDIPLVIISADRPPEKIDIGDGQTIRQQNVFANHILYSANLKVQESQQLGNEKELNIALNTAIELKGPVHINVPFEEPLYKTVNHPTVHAQNVPPRLTEHLLTESLEEFAAVWNKSHKKMVLVGVLPPNSVKAKIVEQLANDPSVLVLTETTSNLHHDRFINCIDQLITTLSDEEFKALQPDVLLTFGGMVVSKRIKAFLRKYPPAHHWHVDAKKAYDTYFVLSHHFKTNINTLLNTFLPQTHLVESNYRDQWLAVKKYRQEKHSHYLSSIPFSDLKAFEWFLTHIPKNTQLQISNSAAIRYAQLFQLDASLTVFCNRGTSGIDGSTSTAIGAALASKQAVTLLTGDLSFFYDSNALWNTYIPTSFRIIVVNNSGGGIFRILPGNKNTENFDRYFETTHNLTAKQLCDMFGFEYHQASNESELENIWDNFYTEGDTPKLLEVFTDRLQNDDILINYFKALK